MSELLTTARPYAKALFKSAKEKNMLEKYYDMLRNLDLAVNDKDVKQIETKQEHFGTTEKVEWEVDDYHLQRLKELGLDNDEDDVNQYISRI